MPDIPSHRTAASGRGLVRRRRSAPTPYLAALLSAGVLIAACSSGTSASQSSSAPADAASAAASEAASATAAPAPDAEAIEIGEVTFLGFEGEDYPDALSGWLQENNGVVTADYAQSAPDLIARFQGGAGQGVDVVSMPNNWTKGFFNQGLLQTLDETKIPNLATLAEPFADLDNFMRNDAGELVAVPFYWHPQAPSYDSSKLPELSSFEELLDPALDGRIAIVDFPIGVLHVASGILGLDPSCLNPEQVAQVEEYLTAVVKQAKTIAPSVGDAATLLGSGEIDAVWNGYPAINVFAAQQGNANVKTLLDTKESLSSSIEFYGIGAEADNLEGAYAFINKMLEPATNAAANSAIQEGSVAADAATLVSAENAALYPYNDIAGFFENAKPMLNPPGESDTCLTAPAWFEKWQSIKALAGS